MNNNTRLFKLLVAALFLAGIQLPFGVKSQTASPDPNYNSPVSGHPAFLPQYLEIMAATADSLSFPRARSLYTWQEPGQWELEIYSTYNYLTNYQIDTNVNYYDPDGDPFNRVIYSWDFFNRLTALTVEKYDSAWYNNSRFEYEFDDHGNPTTQLSYIWFSEDWQITTGNRNSYVYDDHLFINEITREKYNVLQYWSNDERTEYIFGDDSLPSEIITYDWASIEWLPLSRRHTIEWKSYDGEHADGEYFSFVQDAYNQEWISDFRQAYAYGTNGSFEYVEQDFRDDTWINDLKYEEIRDDNSMLSEIRYSEWETGQWVQFEGFRYTYNMDGIDLLEIIAESWDTATSAYINSEKLVYSDFIHVLGAGEPVAPVPGISIFPNPVSGRLCIDAKGMDVREVMMFNALGQIILKMPVNPEGPFSLDLSRQPGGIYYLVLLNEGKLLATRKIIILQ